MWENVSDTIGSKAQTIYTWIGRVTVTGAILISIYFLVVSLFSQQWVSFDPVLMIVGIGILWQLIQLNQKMSSMMNQNKASFIEDFDSKSIMETESQITTQLLTETKEENQNKIVVKRSPSKTRKKKS